MSVTTAVPYFTARPAGPTEGRPGLVVVMEGNGMSQQLLRVCQRFAAEGYVVHAPDLFHRFGGSDGDAAMAEGWYGKLRSSRTRSPTCRRVRRRHERSA